jgi:DeoR/GlpR family transcriptional regulator of sugar metabolism
VLNNKRQQKILDLLDENASVRVSELSKSLGVSEATVRRDLDSLHEKGRVQRIHGGAILVERAAPEPPVVHRTNENIAEKRRIGQTAARLIQDGETIFIGSGTTTLEVARNLVNRQNLTVITNALPIINVLAQSEGISVIATGGLLRLSELSFIGYITDQTLHELRPQKVIMGIRAISLVDGLTNDYLPEVTTDRVIIQSAPEVILVADHTKFGKVSTALVAPLTSIHKIITDPATPPEIVDELRRVNIEVLIV